MLQISLEMASIDWDNKDERKKVDPRPRQIAQDQIDISLFQQQQNLSKQVNMLEPLLASYFFCGQHGARNRHGSSVGVARL